VRLVSLALFLPALGSACFVFASIPGKNIGVEQKATNGLFATLSPRPEWGAQINDRQCKSLICKESENDTFHF